MALEKILQECVVNDEDIEVDKSFYGTYGKVELHYRGLQCTGYKLRLSFEEIVQNELMSSTESLSDSYSTISDECKRLLTLLHPNIIQFLGISLNPKLPMIITESMLTNVTDCIAKYGKWPEELCFSVLHDVALALYFLHESNPPILCLELTSHAVALSKDMRAKLFNPSVSRIIKASTSHKERMRADSYSTHDYRPPDAYHNVRNPQYDIFSYGILMIHIMCGEWPIAGPYRALDKPELICEFQRRAQYIQEIKEIYDKNTSIRLCELIEVCLSDNHTDRPSTPVVLEKLDFIVSISKSEFQTSKIILMKKISDAENERMKALRKNESANQTTLPIPHKPHPCYPGAQLIWKERPKIPIPMFQVNAVVIETKVYVGGGNTKERFHSYDLNYYKWEELSPSPVTNYGLVVFNNKPLAIGGITKQKSTSDIAHTFNAQSNEWTIETTIPSMITARHSLTTFSFESFIITCGGIDAQGIADVVEVFQINSRQWTTCSKLPFASYCMTATIIHGTAYLFGGCNDRRRQSELPIFTDSAIYADILSLVKSEQEPTFPWTRFPSIKCPGSSGANSGGCLLALGGIGKRFQVTKSKLCIFSQLRNEWDILSNMPGKDCYAPTAVTLPNGNLLLIGGAGSPCTPLTDVYEGEISV